jgi:hypothetical protein
MCIAVMRVFTGQCKMVSIYQEVLLFISSIMIWLHSLALWKNLLVETHILIRLDATLLWNLFTRCATFCELFVLNKCRIFLFVEVFYIKQ